MRKAIYFRLKPGAAEEYKKRHDHIPPEMSAVLTAAGYKNYSTWRVDNLLFAYFEVDDEERANRIFAASEVYSTWRSWMEDVIEITPKGQKEWPMELVFFHEG